MQLVKGLHAEKKGKQQDTQRRHGKMCNTHTHVSFSYRYIPMFFEKDFQTKFIHK